MAFGGLIKLIQVAALPKNFEVCMGKIPSPTLAELSRLFSLLPLCAEVFLPPLNSFLFSELSLSMHIGYCTQISLSFLSRQNGDVSASTLVPLPAILSFFVEPEDISWCLTVDMDVAMSRF